MRALILGVTLFISALSAGSPEGELTASARAAIEKSVLEVNAQMTRAAEDRDIDRLFSFMLANDRGSIIQSGNLFETRENALAAVKRQLPRRRRHQIPMEAATRDRHLPNRRTVGVRWGIRNPHRPGAAVHVRRHRSRRAFSSCSRMESGKPCTLTIRQSLAEPADHARRWPALLRAQQIGEQAIGPRHSRRQAAGTTNTR